MNYTKSQLDSLINLEIRETYVKIELLNWNEELVKEIQSLVTQGSISINANSAMRRTCNLTMLIPDNMSQFELSNLINLNKKFKLYIGCKLDDEIMWFKQGVFVFATANFNRSTSGTTVSITARDKMCLLNGQIQGAIPISTIFHQKEDWAFEDTGSAKRFWQEVKTDEEEGRNYVEIDGVQRNVKQQLVFTWVYDIIYELVNHWGKEKADNIFINDIPEYGRLLVKYIGITPLWIQKNGAQYIISDDQQSDTEYIKIEYGDLMGYKKTDFTYPGELVSNVGEAVTSVLDKICNTFGNFEYFYDIDGKFIFQEKKNYLNNSYIALTDAEHESAYKSYYQGNYIAYDFTENNIITSYTNAPKWENIKNDFVVWGNRVEANGREWPIHYHLAIDNKPSASDGKDYRQVLRENKHEAYIIDLQEFWSTEDGLQDEENPKIYYKDEDGDWHFNPIVENNPEALNYWLELIEPTGKYEKFSVNNIGRRTHAVHDDKVTCIQSPQVPPYVFVPQVEQTFDPSTSETFNGYTKIIVDDLLDSAIVAAADNKSCFDVIRDLLYQKLSLQEQITISCLPIYWLQVNDIIKVQDSRSEIYGEYIITSINLPLNYNGLMQITAIRLDSRI